ncbi:hypothetical protein HRbin39_00642 [bacterium HR39]|nr:hypothetical protein HRbin39_00642 [bacterium HR39]
MRQHIHLTIRAVCMAKNEIAETLRTRAYALHRGRPEARWADERGVYESWRIGEVSIVLSLRIDRPLSASRRFEMLREWRRKTGVSELRERADALAAEAAENELNMAHVTFWPAPAVSVPTC